MNNQIIELDPDTYQRHLIHGEGRTWAETNCYVDVWIELLHALGQEPIAVMPFTLAIDFEGDQWTFFKPPLLDIYELYRIDVQELAVWKPLVEHIQEQVARGRPVLVELDSYFLPDTVGTAYKLAHTKSTVAVNEIDPERRHMGYFHNQGYYHVDGDDFLDVFRLRTEPDPAFLPPYVEFAKIRDSSKSDDQDLTERSLGLLRKHLRLVPETNPFANFKQRFEQELGWLLEQDLETFHQYSFATLRQYGACFELSHTYLQWLSEKGESGLEDVAGAFRDISEGAKALQFQLARAISRRKNLDLSALDLMGECWARGISGLNERYL